MSVERIRSEYGLENHGILNVKKVHWNHNTPLLYEDVIKNGEGHMAHLGPIIVRTGLHTGRAAKDKFIVEEPENKDNVWWGKVNRPISQQVFENMFRRLQAYLQDRDVWVQDCFAGYDKRYRLPVRVITIRAWHSLFARNMFIQAKPRRTQESQTGIHRPPRAEFPGDSGNRRYQFRGLHSVESGQAPRPDRWHQLCRRNQEVRVYRPQLPPAAPESALDALFRQCRQEWRCRSLLRSVRHRQDHLVCRSGTRV